MGGHVSKYGAGDAGDINPKGKWYPSWKKQYQSRKEAFAVPKGDDPLWCVVCRKRFKSTGVFQSHLTGKKHIGALKAAGRGAEAEAMQQRIVDERNRKQLAQAQESATAKRSQPAERDEGDEREKKLSKQASFDKGFHRAGGPVREPAEAKPAAQEGGAAAAAAPQPAAANPNGLEWWKGVPSDPEPEEGTEEMTALEKLLAAKAADKSARRGGDWQCPGNYLKANGECGFWNFRDNTRCKQCGATRRLNIRS